MKKVIALIVAVVALSACSTTPIERGCRKGNVNGSSIITCTPKSPEYTSQDAARVAPQVPRAGLDLPRTSAK